MEKWGTPFSSVPFLMVRHDDIQVAKQVVRSLGVRRLRQYFPTDPFTNSLKTAPKLQSRFSLVTDRPLQNSPLNPR
jgi:hypothetical protein